VLGDDATNTTHLFTEADVVDVVPPATPAVPDSSLSARELNQLKRKRRAESKAPPAAPARAAAAASPSPLANTADGDPWTTLCDQLQVDLFAAAWEARHGAALGLAALLRGAPAPADTGDPRGVADLSLRLICVLALDRVADFSSDHVRWAALGVGDWVVGTNVHSSRRHPYARR
jgi:hypothetical protein